MNFAYRVACSVVVLGASVHVGAQEPPSARMSIAVANGRITCSVRTMPLSGVLETLSERTGLTFVAAGEIRGEDVSLELNNVPLEQGLRRLLRPYDTFLYYGAGGDVPPSLRAVWIYPRGSGAALQPMRQESSITADERRRATDVDPHVREAAYVELMSRTDEASRELLVNALRGTTEADEDVRQRLLANALNQGVDLPRALLLDLVRADRSETIRLLALDALTGDPAAVDAASAAATDPSPMVRERAEHILSAQAASRRPPR